MMHIYITCIAWVRGILFYFFCEIHLRRMRSAIEGRIWQPLLKYEMVIFRLGNFLFAKQNGNEIGLTFLELMPIWLSTALATVQ